MDSIYLSFFNFDWIPLKDFFGQLAFKTQDSYIQERINRFCICPTDGPIVDTLLILLTTIKTSPHQVHYKHEKAFLQKLPSEIQNFYHEKIPSFSNNIYQVLKTIYQNSEKNAQFKIYFNKEHDDKRHTLIYSFCNLYPEAHFMIKHHVLDFTNYVSYDVFAHFYDFIYVIYYHIKRWTVCTKDVLYRFIRVSTLLIFNGNYDEGVFSVLNDFDEVLQGAAIEKLCFVHNVFQPTETHFNIFCRNFWPFDITLPNEKKGDQYPTQIQQLGSLLIDATLLLNIDSFLFEFAMGYSNKRIPQSLDNFKISMHDTFAIPWHIAQTLNKECIQISDGLDGLENILIYFDTFKVANPEWMFECFERPYEIMTLRNTPMHDKTCQVINVRESVLLQKQNVNHISKFVVFEVDPILHEEKVNNFYLLKKRTQELYFIENYTLFKERYYSPLINIWNNCTENEKLTFINIINHIFPSSHTITSLRDLWVQFYWLEEDLYSYMYSFVTCFTMFDINQLQPINPVNKSNQVQDLGELMSSFSALGKHKLLTEQCLKVYQTIYNIRQKLQQSNILLMDDCTTLLRKQYKVLFNKLYVF